MLPHRHRRNTQTRGERLGGERPLVLEQVHNRPSGADRGRLFGGSRRHVYKIKESLYKVNLEGYYFSKVFSLEIGFRICAWHMPVAREGGHTSCINCTANTCCLRAPPRGWGANWPSILP